MTGAAHYREAEKILTQVIPTLEKAQRDGVQRESLSAGASISLAMAQVHATLALAAATMDVAGATSNGVVSTGWSEAIA